MYMNENNLKYCREELEMTQKELGYVFGVHESTISGWETNKDIIPLTKLIKFSNLYSFSVDYIIGLNRKNNYIKLGKVSKQNIGCKLKKIRKQLGLTQQEIAKVCGISQTTYSNYELGINLISTLTLYTICKTYKLSMDEILK